MASRCCVSHCKTNFKLSGTRQHKIPTNKELRIKWLNILQLSEGAVKLNTAVCDLHFKNIYVLRKYIETINFVKNKTITFNHFHSGNIAVKTFCSNRKPRQ